MRFRGLASGLAPLALLGCLVWPAFTAASAPPIVESVEPSGGPTAGGTAVRIKGVNFFPGAVYTVKIGSEATSVAVHGETEITARTAATVAGSDEVVVKGPNGISSGGPSFTYVAPPEVISIEPKSGPTAGGTPVIIKGSGFRKGDKLKIGSEIVPVEVHSSEEITAKTAATAAGSDEVVVTDIAGGPSSGGPSYVYVPAPQVKSIAPEAGPTAGGTAVTIEGSGFVAGARVRIGSEATSVEVKSETELIAKTAATAAGSDEVVVSDVGGTSSKGPSYSYVPPPEVTSVEPTEGPSAGGTTVTIKGSGFMAGAKVEIGSEATAVEVKSGTEITASTAAGAAGSDEVLVSDARGTSTGGPSYRYVATAPGGTPPGTGGGTAPGAGGGTPPLIEVGASLGVLGSTAELLPPPVLGQNIDVTSITGVVLVELPGRHAFIPLAEAQRLPLGSIVNATNGTVTIVTAAPDGGTQTGQFFGGEFVLTQGRDGVFVAVLTGGDFAVCPTARERVHLASASSKHASGSHVVRKLWANAHGSFSTKGNYAAGAVAGTEWLTEDLCDGTLIRVTRDKVLVTNLVNHRRLLVRVGHHYLAKAP
jgi:hypothetical protein